jgi:hypothetical protein
MADSAEGDGSMGSRKRSMAWDLMVEDELEEVMALSSIVSSPPKFDREKGSASAIYCVC